LRRRRLIKAIIANLGLRKGLRCRHDFHARGPEQRSSCQMLGRVLDVLGKQLGPTSALLAKTTHHINALDF
jgi:hypothetical protein